MPSQDAADEKVIVLQVISPVFDKLSPVAWIQIHCPETMKTFDRIPSQTCVGYKSKNEQSRNLR
jgi:hypothetical protein